MTNKSIKKTPQKVDDNKLNRTFTQDEAKEAVFECAQMGIGTKSLLKKFASGLENHAYMNEEEKSKLGEELTELFFAFGIETGYIISHCVNKTFEKVAVEMKREIEKEFDCKTYSEKALVDLAVSAYVRNMQYTWKMDANQAYLGQKYDGYRNYLSHEIDRSYRHYISAIETLKAMKQPSFSVNIKTQNAFVAQNQQLNNHSEQTNEAK